VAFFRRENEIAPWTQMVVTGQGGRPLLDSDKRPRPLVIDMHWPAGAPLFIQAFPGGAEADNYALNFTVEKISASWVNPNNSTTWDHY
jgi:hypothetical protein